MKRSWLVLAFLLIAAPRAQAQRHPPGVLPVVPQPQEVTWDDGRFVPAPAETVLRLAASDTAGLGLPAAQLQNTFRDLYGQAPALVAPGGTQDAGATIWIGLPDEDAAFRERCEQLGLWPEPRVGEEGYVLLVRPDEILVAAGTRTGLFYGVQTLRHLLYGYAADAGLPAVRVVDWPDLRYRGIMDDISRGPVPTLAYLKHQVRRYAEMKLNVMTHYVENVVRTDEHAAFAPPDGSLSIAEWRELAAYARRYHVTLVGSFQSFGHFEKILAYPAYSPLGESGRLLSPVLPESIELLRDIYGEMVPAFGAPFFHVNSDETFDLGRGYSKARVDSLGRGVVYAEHILRLHGLLEELGVRMLLWGDIVLEHPEVLGRLPKDIIMLPWNYSPRDAFDDLIEPFQEAGFDVMIAPGVLNSNRIMPDFREADGNIRPFVADGVAHDVLGMLCTVWDDGGSALFTRDWYGLALAADQAWHADPDDPTFDERFSRALYGDPTGALPAALRTLNALADLEPTDGMNEKVLLQQLLPEAGGALRLSLTDLDAVRALADSATVLLESARPGRQARDLDAIRFTAALYRLLADSRFQLLDAAEAYRQASLLQREDPPAARAHVVAALDLLARLRQRWTARAADYRRLWLQENRTHALAEALAPYEAHAGALADAEARLMQALRDVDMGHVLPPPTAVRLALDATEGRYFREWLMSGPLPNPDGADGAQTDYLEALGGEHEARPAVALEWTYDGQTYRWHRMETPRQAEVNLAELYPQQNELVALYAYATIDSPQARRVRALAGSNDGIEVILNGETVFEKHQKRNLMVDEDAFWLPLQEGRNHLLLKISQGKGGWGFSFRLPDVTVRSRKNRYRIVE